MPDHHIIFAWRRVTPPMFMGGAEVSVRVLSRRLADAGYKVSCIGSYVDPRSRASNLDSICSSLVRASIQYGVDVSDGSIRYDYHGVTCTMRRQGDLLDELKHQLQRPALVISAQEGSDEIINCARDRGAETVGWLHSPSPVGLVVLRAKPTYVLATSRFVAGRANAHYGCESIVFFPPFDDVVVKDSASRYAITLINPIPDKGVELFLSLARRFPDRQFLAVEAWYPVQLPAEDLRRNVHYLTRQADMGPVFEQTRVLLVPSRIDEGFGRVVIEAGLHAVPALVPARGGLVEAIGTGPGIIDSFDAETWASAITALDDGKEYVERCRIARENATRFLRNPVSALVKIGVLASNPRGLDD